MSTTQNRQPKGIPVGGQFAASVRDESDISLSNDGDADGFTRDFGPMRYDDKQYGTVRTTNGGELSGYLTTQGATYPIDVETDDGRVVGISGWRVAGVRLEDAPPAPEPDPLDEWADGLADAGLHLGEWAELGDTRVRVTEVPVETLDADDPSTWNYADLPAVATYADLPEIVGGYWGNDHYRLPGLVDSEFRLEKNFDLARVAMAAEPHDYAMEMDEDGNGFGNDPEDAVAAYEELRSAFAERPWDVAPLIAVEHENGELELLDGNHRASLALSAGRTQHPAYVVRANPDLADAAPTRPTEAQVQVRASSPHAGDPVPGAPGWHYPRTKTKGRIPLGADGATRQGRGKAAAFWARQFTTLQGDLKAAWKDAENLLDDATPQIR